MRRRREPLTAWIVGLAVAAGCLGLLLMAVLAKNPGAMTQSGHRSAIHDWAERSLNSPMFDVIEWGRPVVSPVYFENAGTRHIVADERDIDPQPDYTRIRVRYRTKNAIGGTVIHQDAFYLRGGQVRYVVPWDQVHNPR